MKQEGEEGEEEENERERKAEGKGEGGNVEEGRGEEEEEGGPGPCGARVAARPESEGKELAERWFVIRGRPTLEEDLDSGGGEGESRITMGIEAILLVCYEETNNR